ncbi:hypothetical protein LFX25_18660 [Leptospira sp. FAT2]|uniref:LA_0442/LA_0875 N-terminal domain-containing protein n=1 Tax=Leptospira sanjuanensis TaxID=2879643 RepID=UPI001EE978A8|nr:hypothetical protein [Leptospira sanjuanensis]MCG6195265.1 hypothetical protein [Leptospira sanjuanensis]
MRIYHRTGFVFFFFLCVPSFLFADTVLLKDGGALRNVKVTMGGDVILVEDESGNIRKIETSSVKRIVMAEVKSESEPSASNVPKNQGSKKPNSSGAGRVSYSSGVSFWESRIAEPDRIGNFSVLVQSVFLQAETRFEGRYGITLGLENSRFDFRSSSNAFLNPRAAALVLPGPDNIQKNESSATLLALSSLDEGYTPFRTSNSFRVETVSFLPGLKYYPIDGERFSWFAQFAFGFGRSYRTGMYSDPFFHGTLSLGTGVQWNGDSIVIALSAQIRNTLLSNSNVSYRFTEPSLQFSFGIRI